MNTKTKKSKFLFFGLVLLLFVEYHFFYLSEFNSTITILLDKNSRVGVGIISLFFWAFVANWKSTKFIEMYSIYCLYTFILVTVYSYYLMPSQTFYSVLEATSMILVLLLLKPFFKIFIQYDSVHSLFKWVNIIVLIWCVVISLQNTVAANTGEQFLVNFFSYSDLHISSRLSNVRIQLQSLGNIVPIYNAYNLMTIKSFPKPKQRYIFVLNAISLVVVFYCVIFIAQTRIFALAILISIIMMALKTSGRTIKQLATIGFLLISAAILVATGVLDAFLDSLFNVNNSDSVGLYYRVEEYQKCILFFISNPVFGRGFFSGQYYNTIYATNLGIIWTNDVGLIGLIGGGGIIAGLLYLWPMLHAIKNYQHLRNNKIKALYLGYLTYLLSVSVTMMMTDPKVVFAFPFVFAVFEYISFEARPHKVNTAPENGHGGYGQNPGLKYSHRR